jgi:hypothetical protein
MLVAPDPRHIPPWAARIAAGRFGVAFMTELRGADNRRARRRLRLGARTSQLARGPNGRARPSGARGMTGEGAGTAGARCTVAPIAGGPADAEA